MQTLRKAGSIWVEGEERFFDRESELAILGDRVADGDHTLLTAQRRMGKTSLLRELLRRLSDEGDFETLFVDVEGATDPAHAIAEIATRARTIQGAWSRIRDNFSNFLQTAGGRIEEISMSEIAVKLRAGIDPGNWQRRGDEVMDALASESRPVVLVIDELPILVNRMLKGHDYQITPERRESTDHFLSWLRKNAQEHRGRICIIISGSVGLEPILQQAGLSAQANIFSPFELRPWDSETASECLAALSRGYGLDLSEEVREDMCRRLRCCVPHHVQQFFTHLHEDLRQENRAEATLDDVATVYERDLLSVRGQIALDHYETRLKMVLGDMSYQTAMNLLTEAAVNDGLLTHEIVERYGSDPSSYPDATRDSITDILYILQHDGYLYTQTNGYRFVSGLLEDWWRARHAQYFTSITQL